MLACLKLSEAHLSIWGVQTTRGGREKGSNLCIIANLRDWRSAGDFSVFSQKRRLSCLVRNRKVVDSD